jgi:L-seryl-tRNA(Ser) seleniumtransferase
MNRLDKLPSVEKILQTREAAGLSERFGRPLTLAAIRAALDELRAGLRADLEREAPDLEDILAATRELLDAWTKPRLRPVINATGVILHTSLGRAPLSRAALHAMQDIAVGYSNLELDLDSGKRGTRLALTESLLQRLTGAEASTVVNNNAAAVLLTLAALAGKKHVIIARSQLVEIGGGFRMPDVMRLSGAKLIEVGTTNKVRLRDYEERFAEAAFVMRAHRSNFKIVGFTEEPAFGEVAVSAHRAGLTVLDDLGSGALLDTARYGLAHEPTIQESIEAGSDVTCFSGDKLLGGPQAGVVIGKAELIHKMAIHPLARAVRADKTCLAALAATLNHYLRNEAEQEIPVWKMISVSPEAMRGRAENWARTLKTGEVCAGESKLGGGSLPGESLPTYVLSLGVAAATSLIEKLRRQDPPIIARAERGRILLDPRTVQPEDDRILLGSLAALLAEAA